jgi:hypothetical protein
VEVKPPVRLPPTTTKPPSTTVRPTTRPPQRQNVRPGIRRRGEEELPEHYEWVWLGWRTYFLTPEGGAVAVEPGGYWVQSIVGTGLQLTPEVEGETIKIRAREIMHGLEVEKPVALAIPRDTESQFIVLLLPEGMALQALGSHSGFLDPYLVVTPLAETTLAHYADQMKAK